MTYEYLCTACGYEWEADQSITAKPLKDCPKCKEAKAQRQVSGGTGFVLKGGGWYADLYGSSKPAAKEASKDTGSGDSSAKTESTKSESSSTDSSSSSSSKKKASPTKTTADA